MSCIRELWFDMRMHNLNSICTVMWVLTKTKLNEELSNLNGFKLQSIRTSQLMLWSYGVLLALCGLQLINALLNRPFLLTVGAASMMPPSVTNYAVISNHFPLGLDSV